MLKRRPDGTAVEGLSATRRIMPYLMRGRNESAVYFEQTIDLTKTLAFIDGFNARHEDLKVTPFHLVCWAAVRTLHERPNLNRFVAGGRIYQRDGIWLSYSAKKEFVDGAPLVVVKRRFDPSESFADMARSMGAELTSARSDRPSRTDKELKMLLKLRGLPLRGLMALQRVADALGLLPRSFIEGDPMFASAFFANLGSLKMDAAYHHLYEYGSISIFCVIGRTMEQALVREGEATVVPTLTLRFSYDERIEDGLYANRALEHLRTLVEDPLAAGATVD